MKFFTYKNRKVVSAIFMAGIMTFVPLAQGVIYATSAENKRDEAQNNLNKTNQQIDQLQNIQGEIESELSAKAQEVASLLTEQRLLEADMADTQAQIDQATVDLAAAQEKEAEQYEAMKLRIQYMYENGSSESIWTAIFNSNGIGDLLNRIEYVNQVYDSDRDMLTEYQETVQQVEDLKNTLEAQMADMVAMEESYKEQQAALEAVMKDLKAQSADYANQIATAQALADKYAKTVAEQNEIIRKQEEERKRQEEERKKKEAEEKKKKEEEEKRKQEAANNAANNSSTSSSDTSSSTSSDTTSTPASSSTSGSSNPSTSASGTQIVNYALQYVGNPYVWGGNSLTDGIDCSGFVHAVLANFGISSPRYSQAFKSWGNEVSYNNIQAGDIVVYPGHVAIYIGNGCIVEAQSKSTGITSYRSVNCHTITAIRRAP